MNHSPLVTPSWLAEHLDDPTVRVAEIQYEPDVDEYRQGHIPGAMHWFWKDVFWDRMMRQFVTPEQMAGHLGRWGISDDVTLVLYSGRNQYAVYGYWVLKTMCGHPDVRVLDGSRRRWVLEGRELTTEVRAVTPVEYRLRRSRRDDSTRVSRDDVLANLGKPGRILIDARYAEEYRGERVKPGTGFDYGAERYGHIPGAVNLVFRDLLDPNDFRFRPVEELVAIFRGMGAAPDQAGELVAYCRLGHRASLVWFTASEVLGWSHASVYDGSWTEWGSIVGAPIER
jgi:thiosulfate/3-mercaptopyruvate sulfurtransferase